MMDEKKIARWFLENFHVHTDWTGTRVETRQHCQTVKEVIDKFIRDLGNEPGLS